MEIEVRYKIDGEEKEATVSIPDRLADMVDEKRQFDIFLEGAIKERIETDSQSTVESIIYTNVKKGK
jgi:hypothetical protein